MKLRHRSDWLLLIAPTERPIPESRWQTCCRASGTCQLLDTNQTKGKKKKNCIQNFGSLGSYFYFLSRRMKGNATIHHPTFTHPTQGLIHTHTLPNPFALVLIVYSSADPVVFIITCFRMLYCFYLYFCPFVLSCGAAEDLFSQFNVGDSVDSDK